MQSIILIGPPGAGKTTIGKILAKKLQFAFFDTDSLIEKSAGKPISQIFLDDGEAVFRELETVVVIETLTSRTGILSLGGGAVMTASIAAEIEKVNEPVVFLSVGIGQAAPRVGFNKERPLLLINPRQQWLALMEKRIPIYRKLSDLEISTDSKKPNEVAREILISLESMR